MAVRSIFHTGFVVRDLDVSVRFYADGLGLRLRHRQTQDNDYTRSLVGYTDACLRIAQFQLPDGAPPPSGHVLELVEYQAPKGGPADRERNTIGAGHLAFLVDDIEAMTARLTALGATPLSPPAQITEGINRGGSAVYLYDPDGVMLELLQPRPAGAGSAEPAP
jgi:catechol 2,3-dioxygenase-like lactoylglutathione lyase family enzyme